MAHGLGPRGPSDFCRSPSRLLQASFTLFPAGFIATAQVPSEFSVSWNGGNLFDQLNNTTAGWSQVKQIAPATTSSTVLQIGFRDDPGYIGLDDVVVTAVMSPLMQAVPQGDGSLSLTWSTQPGLTYQPQFATNLLSPNWINLGSPLTASGPSLSVPDFTTPDPYRFYRVAVQSQTPGSK